jgi:hypothetical protein
MLRFIYLLDMIPCSKCETVDFPKYIRMKLRDNGQRTQSVASYCILCHREEARIWDARFYKKKLAYNRIWRKENRDKVNTSKRKSYFKTKHGGL